MSDLRTELETWVRLLREDVRPDAPFLVSEVCEGLDLILERTAHPDDLTPEDVEALRPIVDKQRRERIATAAMQGLLASGCYWNSEHHKTEVAQTAAGMADAILAELDKEES